MVDKREMEEKKRKKEKKSNKEMIDKNGKTSVITVKDMTVPRPNQVEAFG